MVGRCWDFDELIGPIANKLNKAAQSLFNSFSVFGNPVGGRDFGDSSEAKSLEKSLENFKIRKIYFCSLSVELLAELFC